ncbi:MAG: protease synthase/sporulation negative transcriptional regulator PaiB [Parvularculaceae bacterium]
MNAPYPRPDRLERDQARIIALMRDHPFAAVITAVGGRPVATQIPLIYDEEPEPHGRLRGHFAGNNPQAEIIDGAEVLALFAGPHAYVSPRWWEENVRGPTWDYVSVQARGRASLRRDPAFQNKMWSDLANLGEARRHDLAGDRPWRFADAAPEYIEDRRSKIVAFEIEIAELVGISKLHADFADEDAARVASKLEEGDPTAQAVGARIRARLDR